MLKTILDCDPGLDDAFAIMLAVRHTDLLGVTTVAGNATLDHTTDNALRILDAVGRPDVPVYAGCSAPLVSPLVTAEHIHGPTGLAGADLPEASRAHEPIRAVDFIVEAALEERNLNVVAVGPLTNIAAALVAEPRIASRIACLSLMGGSTAYGNATVAAEFNIRTDPEAAARVFSSGIPIRMCGLNLTRRARITPERLARIESVGTGCAALGGRLLRRYIDTVRNTFGIEGADLHDALAVAALVRPDLFASAPLKVYVELRGEYTRGMTVCDTRHLRGSEPLVDFSRTPLCPTRGEEPNAEVGLDLDAEGFFDFLVDTLKELP